MLLTTYFRSTAIPSEVSGPGLVSASNQVAPLSVLMYNFTAIAEEEKDQKKKVQALRPRQEGTYSMKEAARKSNPLTGRRKTWTSTMLQSRLSLKPGNAGAFVSAGGLTRVTARRCGPRKTALRWAVWHATS